VDLPGYGYAKLSKKQCAELRELIQWYITHPEADTALICLIVDAKVGLTSADKEFIMMMDTAGKNYIIAVNKIDKINQKSQSKLKKEIQQNLRPGTPVFYYSAFKGKTLTYFKNLSLNKNK
jgi:GTP-binding protein